MLPKVKRIFKALLGIFVISIILLQVFITNTNGAEQLFSEFKEHMKGIANYAELQEEYAGAVLAAGHSNAVTESDENTLMPYDYNFYIKYISGTTQVMRSHEGEKITYSGKADGSDRQEGENFVNALKMQNGNAVKAFGEGEYYVWYRDMGKYKNTRLDIKMSLMDYKVSNEAKKVYNEDKNDKDKTMFTFTNTLGIREKGIEWFQLKLEFYEHDDKYETIDQLGNQTKLTGVKGYHTITDVDGYQGIVIDNNKKWSKVYITKGNPRIAYKISSGDNARYYFSKYASGTGPEGQDNPEDGYLTALYNTGNTNSLEMIYSFPKAVGHPRLCEYLGHKGSKAFATEMPDITKSVKDSNEESEKGNTLSSTKEEFTYIFKHAVPIESSQHYYESYVLRDFLPKGIEYIHKEGSFEVTDQDGKNCTSKFEILTLGPTPMDDRKQLVIEAKNTNTSEFYNNQYTFKVKVKMEEKNYYTSDADGYNPSTGYIEMVNQVGYEVRDPGIHIWAHRMGSSNEVTTKVPLRQMRIIKKDSIHQNTLQGATIGIYSDNNCTQEIQRLTTSSDGTVTSALLDVGTYYVKEITPPPNYALNTQVYQVQLTEAGSRIVDVNITDKPNTATIEVSKIDKTTGNIITRNGTTFTLQEWSVAQQTWVRPTHILTNTFNGNTSDNTAAILKEKTSGTKGTYTGTIYYNAQNEGKFRLLENTRPYGYTNSNWKVENIQIQRDGQQFIYNSHAKNDQVRGQINFKKNDTEVNYNNSAYAESFAQGDSTLQGAVYKLCAKDNIVSPDNGTQIYQAGQEIERRTTDVNGKITWSNLYLGKYYIQEVTPPKGYIIDPVQYEVDLNGYYNTNYFQQGNQTTQNIVYQNAQVDANYSNTEHRVISKEKIKKQAFQLTKLSSSDSSTMDHPLQGAGFKIYLIKDLTAVKNGTIKPNSNGDYNIDDLKRIDFKQEQTALNFTSNVNGARIGELFTDENGYLKSPELAYGKYIIVETTVPEEHIEVEPFIVDINQDSRTPQAMLYPDDKEFEARIKVVKQDSTTGETVLKPNAAYRIWDVKNEKYIEQMTTQPKKQKYGTAENPYITSEDGVLYTPNNLKQGEYELIEVKAPEGYVLAGKEEQPTDKIRFSISSHTVYKIDPDFEPPNAVIEVVQKNVPQVGTITVQKQGEFLSSAQEQEEGYEFGYTTRPVTDAKFAIYAKENILTQDNQGNTIYEKDQKIKEVQTNDQGKAIFEKMPLGQYYIKEIEAGEGFVLNTEAKEVQLTYEGQEVPVIYRDCEFVNERQKVQIDITKKDREEEKVLQGAIFELYTKEPITYTDDNGEEQTIPKDALVLKATSGEDGKAIFNNEKLPLGKYYMKEAQAPKGYATNSQIIDFDCSYIGQEQSKVEKTADFTNMIIKLKIRIVDYESATDLVGTQIVLKDIEGNEIGTYTIDEHGEIEVKGLEIGKTYLIEEQKERYGYVKDLLFTNSLEDANELIKGKEINGAVIFTIKDTEEPQKVTLKNIAKVGNLEIEKIGEVLVGSHEDDYGNIVFEYEKQRIDTAKFEIKAKENIIHPDGKQGIIAEAGTVIGEGETQNGILSITKFSDELIQNKPEVMKLLLNRGLPLGVYEIKETQAPKGFYYRQDEQIRTIRIDAHNNTEQVEKQTVTIENPKQSTNVGKARPEISIEKEAEREVYKIGEEVVYTITVKNTGNTELKNVEVKESMINGSFDEAEGIKKLNNNVVLIERLKEGEEKTLTYRYEVTRQDKGEINNEVKVTGTAVKKLTNQNGEEVEEELEKVTDDTEEEVWVDTVIEKTTDKQVYQPGSIIEYTLNITNPNDEAIENAKVEDEKVKVGSVIRTSKEGITVEQDGEINIGRVEPRERIEIVYKYQIPEDYQDDTLTNEANLSGTIKLKPMSPKKAESTVEIKKSGIEITKEVERDRYRKGETVNYTITVKNIGATVLKDVLVEEKLLKGRFDEKAGTELINDQTIKIDKLDVGEKVVLTYIYTVEDEKILGEKISNQVIATATGVIENLSDPENPILEQVSDEADKDILVKGEDPVEETIEKPEIVVEKEAEKEVYKVGEEIVYTITVKNTGNTDLKDIKVQETMNKGTFDEVEGTKKIDDNTISIERLNKEEEKSLTYRYVVTEENKGEINNKVITTGIPVKKVTNENGEETEQDLEPVTDDAEETVWVETYIEKKADKKNYQPGSVVKYTLYIMNPNDEVIKNAEVHDDKVKKGSIISTTKEDVTVKEDGIIEIGKIEPRERIEIVYEYELPEEFTEEYLNNEAELSGTINLEEIPPQKAETTVEVKKSEIEITKKANKEYYQKGEVIEYTITVKNVGETVLEDVLVKETLLGGAFKEKEGTEKIDDQTVKIAQLEVGQSVNLTYEYTVGPDKMIGEKIQNKVNATGTGIIENPEDPENPKKEQVEDEADEEVVLKDIKPASGELGVYKTDQETGEPIKGATFGIYAAENIMGPNDIVLIEKDVLIERSTTDENGFAKFKADLPIGKFYIVELQPIAGYINNTQRLDIDSTSIYSTEQEYLVGLKMQNKKTEVAIEKVEKIEDLTKRQQIIGAKLQILEENNQLVEEWTTDGNPHVIKGLETQKTYILHEVEPARGYVTQNDIQFSINTDGSLTIDEQYTIEETQIPTIIMQDDITRVRVDIVDKETKEPIKDVVVQIVDKNTGEVVYEYTTDGQEHIIEKLPIGDYIVVEKDYPKDKGYVSIETEEFSVKDTPELQEKIIEQDYTKLDVTLLDEVTKNILPGGKLELKNEKGEVVATIDDTGVTYYVERLPVGEYTLVEVQTPEGYEKASDIKFTLEDTKEIQHVVMENKRLPFDLKVDKYASKVIVNGITKTGTDYEHAGQIVKIDIDAKKIKTQNVDIEYTIRVTNSGKVAGSVGKVVDKIPSGFKFIASENEKYWVEERSGEITTTAFENTRIEPGQYIELKIKLKWTQSEFNLGNKENIVTIGEFKNNPGFEDEDRANDKGSSNVLLSVKTGLEIVLTKQIIATILVVLTVIGVMILVEIAWLKKKLS